MEHIRVVINEHMLLLTLGLYNIIIGLFLVSLLAIVILVKNGNLTAMKGLARNGVAVFSGKIEKDYKLLNYVNKEGVAWLSIPNVCYAPIMYSKTAKYKTHNFLQKPSIYGELYMREECIRDLTIVRGLAKGKSVDLRHANFSVLGKCEELYNEKGVVKVYDSRGLTQYSVLGVVTQDKMGMLKEEKKWQGSRVEVIARLEEMAGCNISGYNEVIMLQSATEVEVVTVILGEETKK